MCVCMCLRGKCAQKCYNNGVINIRKTSQPGFANHWLTHPWAPLSRTYSGAYTHTHTHPYTCTHAHTRERSKLSCSALTNFPITRKYLCARLANISNTYLTITTFTSSKSQCIRWCILLSSAFLVPLHRGFIFTCRLCGTRFVLHVVVVMLEFMCFCSFVARCKFRNNFVFSSTINLISLHAHKHSYGGSYTHHMYVYM